MINRISQIYANRQARRGGSESAEPDVSSISKEPLPDDLDDGNVIVETSSITEGTPDFDSVERLGLFGLLHYTLTSRYHKVMLIGLLNVILITTFFLVMFFFLLRVKCGQAVVYGTTPIPTVTSRITNVPDNKAPVNQECPSGYTLMDTVCWKFQSELMGCEEARGQCNLNAAILFELKSEKQNQLFLNFLNNQSTKLWMGVTCTGSNLTTCKQDDLLVWPFPYSSFAMGSPDGPCTYYDTTASMNESWASGNCDLKLASVCQVTPTVTEKASSPCTDSYDNNCYYYYDTPMSFSGAQDYCRSRCGSLPSVVSHGENELLQNLAHTEWILLGGLLANEKRILWADGVAMEYLNLHVYNPRESCLMLNTMSGNWSSVACSYKAPFVCKVASGVEC